MRCRYLAVLLFALVVGAQLQAEFADDFTGATLRVDYYHTGTASEEHFGLDRARVEGPWPGSRTQLIDPSNLGKYLVEVVNQGSNRVLYTRGFCSIYGEWETTAEAREGTWRCLPEAVRVPEPRRPFQLRIRKRDARQVFHEVWSVVIDPASRFVDRAPVPAAGVWTVFEHGEPAVKVDLLVLGDGYVKDEMEEFHEDVKRLVKSLFETEPFASRREDFNVRAIDTPAEHSGVTRPRKGVFRQSPLGARYNVFDLPRYALTFEDRAWRDVAAAAPYDFVLILMNEEIYGGGGIHNLYAITAADSRTAAFLVAHELGHHVAGLADEYFAAKVAYEESLGPRVEPWEPNVTALLDPARLKWRDLVEPGTPLPTPWGQDAFAQRYGAQQERRQTMRAAGADESAVAAQREENGEETKDLLETQDYSGKVGAFEGAMYRAKGLYRPCVDCTMFVGREAGYCPVCRRAIERAVDLYVR